MVQPKPAASLSSSLLARKGDARPAMRAQDERAPNDAGDDLGWNDMGSPVPPVLIEREALKAGIETPPIAVADVSLATAVRIRRQAAPTTPGSKAAFTLRLDADRHLRLRLASAITRRSSQQLMTQALDAFLQSLPEVEALVAQLPPAKPKR
ncbi:hypothetical protein IFR23_18255 [Sphingomonas sp. CFBP 13603]|uniref:hypothetical protein n=1 Tax=Sphingomonas sp. CFBP 13603 TaxID=2774040 RepID=UPI001866CD49|nr:hypothetical protein [Sphingomonas sp. CFBP 13603]MBE2993937.1 hypothetical protein [Sphingomonas sp. CFBP 13603]